MATPHRPGNHGGALSQALRAFTAVRYSRPSPGPDSPEARNSGVDGTALGRGACRRPGRRQASATHHVAALRPAEAPRRGRRRTTDMGTLNALIELVGRTLSEWRSSGISGLAFNARNAALLTTALFAVIAATVLVWRALRGRLPGRTAIALPAVLPRSVARLRSPIAFVRHAPFLLFLAGLPFLLPRAGRSAVVAVGASDLVSGPAHRRHHGRLAQHAVALQRSAAEDAERHRVLEHDGGGGIFHPRPHEGALPRSDRARAVRQRGLRHHAVHHGLREPAAQPEDDQRRQRVAAFSRPGHDHHEGDRRGGRSVQRVRFPRFDRATSW